MDLEFLQKSSKLRAQSMVLVLNLLTWGFLILAPDHRVALFLRAACQGEGIEGGGQ